MTEPDLLQLLKRMTLEEKLGQMMLVAGAGDTVYAQAQSGRIGAITNLGHWNEGRPAARYNHYQRAAVEKSRLGIPLLFGRDVIHGYRTILPITLGQAASFNESLIETGAKMAGAEALAHGVHWTFAPMVDVARDPRWGRVAESCGEEPLLNARFGAAMVRGFQSAGVAACAKHYLGYGAAEGGREYNTTWIPEAHLRNTYLPSFEACVKAGVQTVMSAFNDLNGIPASGNAHTIRGILKGELGFNGLVVSDWASVEEMTIHGYTADRKEAALRGVEAGVDMEMVSTCYVDHVAELLASGALKQELIDDAVLRILRVKAWLGLFESPYLPEGDEAWQAKARPQHHDIARRAAEESCVLLKNENATLPLGPDVKHLAIIGPLADSPQDQVGCWCMDAEYDTVVTPLTTLRRETTARGHGAQVVYVPGVASSRDTSHDGFAAAAQAAADADATIMFLGEEANLSGEARSRAYLGLPGAQLELLQAVAKKAKRLCVVIMAGRPLLLDRVAPLTPAILYAWHPGTMGGEALADLLLGVLSPSGKLPISFPWTEGQIPVYCGRRNTGRPQADDARIGIPLGTPLNPDDYISTYIDCDARPMYEFGFGLSYTTFEYANLALSREKLAKNETLVINATLRNTGDREATEVVQLYVRDNVGSLTRPLKELKDFKRVTLAAGEEQRLRFDLRPEQLMFYNADNQRVLEPGTFTLWVGGSSEGGLSATFEVKAEG